MSGQVAKWISVKDATPGPETPHVVALCSVTMGDSPEVKAKRAVFLRAEFVYEGSKRHDQGLTEEVKYWMPLPEPPED